LIASASVKDQLQSIVFKSQNMIQANIKKVQFITGLPLTGKSTFIEEKFNNKNKFYTINYAQKFSKLFGDYDDLNNTYKSQLVCEEIIKDINTLSENSDITLIVEYCTGFHASSAKLESLIDKLIMKNWYVFVKQMETGLKTHRFQQMAENDPSYCPSMILNDHHYKIVSKILDNSA
jgi:predicted kinase